MKQEQRAEQTLSQFLISQYGPSDIPCMAWKSASSAPPSPSQSSSSGSSLVRGCSDIEAPSSPSSCNIDIHRAGRQGVTSLMADNSARFCAGLSLINSTSSRIRKHPQATRRQRLHGDAWSSVQRPVATGDSLLQTCQLEGTTFEYLRNHHDERIYRIRNTVAPWRVKYSPLRSCAAKFARSTLALCLLILQM